MKKKIKIENLDTIKKVKLLSTVLLSLPEIDDFEADLDNSIITLNLNSNINDSIITYYINSINLKVIDIK